MKTLYAQTGTVKSENNISREEYLNIQAELKEDFKELENDSIILADSYAALERLKLLESLDEDSGDLYDLAMETITAPIGYTTGVLTSVSLESKVKDFVNSAIQKAKDLWAAIYKKILAGLSWISSKFKKKSGGNARRAKEAKSKTTGASDAKQRKAEKPGDKFTKEGYDLLSKAVKTSDVAFIMNSDKIIDEIIDDTLRGKWEDRYDKLAYDEAGFPIEEYHDVYTDKDVGSMLSAISSGSDITMIGFYTTFEYSEKTGEITKLDNEEEYGEPGLSALQMVEDNAHVVMLVKQANKFIDGFKEASGNNSYNGLLKLVQADVAKAAKHMAAVAKIAEDKDSYKEDFLKI